MPARDSFHDNVRHALERDGWEVTHDPLNLSLRRRKLYIDLGAERLIAAQKGIVKIAVEIKTFSGPSDVRDLEGADNAMDPLAKWREELERILTEHAAVPYSHGDIRTEVVVDGCSFASIRPGLNFRPPAASLFFGKSSRSWGCQRERLVRCSWRWG